MKRTLLSCSLMFFVLNSFSQTVYDKLFITEYFEGKGNQRAIEIGNYTGAPISLNRLRITLFFNAGSKNFQRLIPTKADDSTSTSLKSGEVFVFYNTSAKVPPAMESSFMPNTTASKRLGVDGSFLGFNGNDVIQLEYDIDGKGNWITADQFGMLGEDPGVAWTDRDGLSSFNMSLSRKSNLKQGVHTNPSVFNLSSEWEKNYGGSLPQIPFTTLGLHQYKP